MLQILINTLKTPPPKTKKVFMHMAEQEISQEELLYVVNDKIDALIELLIEKNVISEDEYAKKLDSLYEESEEESDVDEEDEEESDDSIDEENYWNPDWEYADEEETETEEDYSDVFPDEAEETPFD
ncbi:hypothetical protein D6774_04835 [Candidatus Woesearchaeota archaeon]|nr:MAG: hypothetical protein D6774_04835 [Candidatus Woesearchaeota archaeon]